MTVEEIVDIEWTMFDQVHNIGGRASCQEDPRTFFIMRSSQLRAWSPDMRESYGRDLLEARNHGRNLLSEKYGYMMERTSPLEYAQIRDRLPVRSPEKLAQIDRICSVHVGWMKEMSSRYPHLAGRGRATQRHEDTPYTTSFETYLWGELATYSLETLEHYWAHIQTLQQEGRNMNEEILRHTVAQYGYSSLDEAESRLAGK